jgi:hypothetical protein
VKVFAAPCCRERCGSAALPDELKAEPSSAAVATPMAHTPSTTARVGRRRSSRGCIGWLRLRLSDVCPPELVGYSAPFSG